MRGLLYAFAGQTDASHPTLYIAHASADTLAEWNLALPEGAKAAYWDRRGRTLEQQLEAVIDYLKSPGSGPDATTSYEGFVERRLRELPIELEPEEGTGIECAKLHLPGELFEDVPWVTFR